MEHFLSTLQTCGATFLCNFASPMAFCNILQKEGFLSHPVPSQAAQPSSNPPGRRLQREGAGNAGVRSGSTWQELHVRLTLLTEVCAESWAGHQFQETERTHHCLQLEVASLPSVQGCAGPRKAK